MIIITAATSSSKENPRATGLVLCGSGGGVEVRALLDEPPAKLTVVRDWLFKVTPLLLLRRLVAVPGWTLLPWRLLLKEFEGAPVCGLCVVVWLPFEEPVAVS